MILLDTTQICLSSSLAFSEQLKQNSDNKQKAKDILRHIILSCIKGYKKKFECEYGRLVICCDSKHYWRRDLFPQYKYLRKKMREQSDLDWKLIFDTINDVTSDLLEHFPYPVICCDGAESDDVIATLTEKFSTVDDPEKIIIISSDKDFVQLHKYPNVVQFSPQAKKNVSVDDPVAYLKEKIIRGDKSDCIPNIFSDSNVFVDGTKQTPVTKKKLEEYMLCESADVITDEAVKANYIRNQTLIDFNFIPANLKQDIIKQYYRPTSNNKVTIFNYLVSHNCSALLNDIDSF